MRLKGFPISIMILIFVFTSAAVPAFSPSLPNQELIKINDLIKSSGNGSAIVRPLWEGNQSWYSRWKLIARAKSTIDCNFFEVKSDLFGEAFLGLLAKKSRDGVKIRLMIDNRSYTSGNPRVTAELIQVISSLPNLSVKLYNPVFKSSLGALEEANSISSTCMGRVIIVDSESCIVGGRNIGMEAFVGPDDIGKGNYFLDLLIHGRAVVHPFKKAFENEWNSLKNSYLERFQGKLDESAARLDMAYRVMSRFIFGSMPFDPEKKEISGKLRKELVEMNSSLSKIRNFSSCDSFHLFQKESKRGLKIVDPGREVVSNSDNARLLIQLITSSREEVFIQNSFIAFSKNAYSALKRASARGVRIVLKIAGKNSASGKIPLGFMTENWKQILKDLPTCRIIVSKFPSETVRSGLFIFDSQIAVVCAYSRDLMSDSVPGELVAVIHDGKIATDIRLKMDKEMEKSVEYIIENDKEGKIVRLCGPTNQETESISKRLKFLQKLGFLNPVF